MGKSEIPVLGFGDLSLEIGDDEKKKEAWKEMSGKVRGALDTHSCFFLMTTHKNSMTIQDFEELVRAMEALFDLPVDTKMKYADPNDYGKYLTASYNPLVESFRIDEATNLPVAQAFAHLMWPDSPDASHRYGEVIHSMSSKALKLSVIIMKLILESFGIGKYGDSFSENLTSSFRMLKHKVPESYDSSGTSIPSHTDTNLFTLLWDNQVQGLEVCTKQGNWIPISFPAGSVLVIVGDCLKAWSNGRLTPVEHRVVMKGEKVRYSCVLFVEVKNDVNIEVPQELVDEAHPLRYRPFTYSEYTTFFAQHRSTLSIENFAGI